MRTQGKPGLWLGLLSGLFLTFPLVAIFYLGYRLAALPFPPFNLFFRKYPCAEFVLRCLWEARWLLLRSPGAGNRPQYPVFRVGEYDAGSSAASGVGRELARACPGRVGWC
jgi:hypothetical protein